MAGCRAHLIRAAVLACLSGCSRSPSGPIPSAVVFEFHHDLLTRLPEGVECKLVGFPQEMQRRGMHIDYRPEDAHTWLILPSRGTQSDNLSPILVKLRLHPSGMLSPANVFRTWKGWEIEVMYTSKDPQVAQILRNLSR